uniref:Uncharacterized protein n=1 Tax=Glyptapanteles indiensis TaxID=92994 RepID=B7S987_GLYIN|nr:hypothetical protein GIP_L7_0010 [Glyptapanteles indiensis]
MWRDIILCCLVLVNVSRSEIKINNSKQKSYLERLKCDARELIQICFTNNSNPVVISADLLDNSWDPGGNLLIVIDREFNKQITGFLPSYPTYVLSFKSIDNLKPVIDNLQKSKFWNINSPFVMVGIGSRCPSPRRMLEIMWNWNLLSVYYLCDKKNSTVVFTLNPYASYAPAPWELIDKFGDNDKKLTFFKLEYTKDPEICKNITFDKTDHLEGTKIKIVQFEDTEIFSEEENRKFADNVVKIKLKADFINLYKISALINATPTLDIISTVNEPLRGDIKQFADSKYDIYNTFETIDVTDYEYVDVMADYTNEETFLLLTKKTDSLTEISKLTNDVNFVVGTILLLIMFTIVMVIINRDDIGLALMDMVRLVTGMTLETPLNRLAMKFIFFFGFLFSFLIVPDFLGHISAILSKPLERNVDTLRDLHENKFHVYYWHRLHNDILNEKLWVTDEDKKYLHPVSSSDIQIAIFNVRQNSTIACIHFTQTLQYLVAQKSNFYVSKEAVFKKQLVYLVRKNWPLKSKFDQMALNAMEQGFGFSTFYKKRYLDKIAKKLASKRKIEESDKYDELDYDNLIFNYYSFGCLVAFGVLSFGIEVLLVRYFRVYRQFQMRARY